jgi:copper chaperone
LHGLSLTLDEEKDMDFEFTVQGMTCGHCEMAVKKAIARLDITAQVHIDRIHNSVKVEHSNQTKEALSRAITQEGYVVS